MLDVKEALKDFKPIDIESVEQKSGKLPENIAEAIKLYNKALDDVRYKSEDIAIIALKKAISLHPVFYEAMNLLGLCYALVGKEDAARDVFQKVINADDSSIKAMEYIKKMESADEGEQANFNTGGGKSKKTGGKNWNPALLFAKGLGAEDKKLYFLKYVVGFVAGVLLVSLIWLAVPGGKALFTVRKVENIIKDPELEAEIAQLNERIERLEADLKEKNEENLKITDDFQIYKEWTVRLNEANKEYQDGNYVESADLLFDKQGIGIPEDLYDYYQSLWDKVRFKAAEELYREGYKLYNNNKSKDPDVYRQALEKFETSISYIGDDEVSYKSNLYYQAGKAASRCNETGRAIELFEYVVNEYPGTSLGSNAASRLKELKSENETG